MPKEIDKTSSNFRTNAKNPMDKYKNIVKDQLMLIPLMIEFGDIEMKSADTPETDNLMKETAKILETMLLNGELKLKISEEALELLETFAIKKTED